MWVELNNLNRILKRNGIGEVRWNVHRDDYLKLKNKKYNYIIGNPLYFSELPFS